MAVLNIDKTRNALQDFDFKALFIEELGWSNPSSSSSVTETIKDIDIIRTPIAELSGAIVFEVSAFNGLIPNPKDRAAIAKEIQKLHFEHVIIFVDNSRNQSIWHWLKNQDKKIVSREHIYIKGQPGDLFISKISSLVFDLSEFDADGNIPIADVASRIKSALDIERVTKKFYGDYQVQHVQFLEYIRGIDDERDRQWYASVILNRLMFIYFLQKRLFLDNGKGDYLSEKLEYSKEKLGKNKFYNVFLDRLFFEGFAISEEERSVETKMLIGKIKFLNGGLFLKHKIELKYEGKIEIEDKAFDNLFELFDSYSWTLDDTPGGKDNEINPDVLGYIFEKYINQKAFGAYYTRTEITEYLCEQTVYKLILDEINVLDIDQDVIKQTELKISSKRFDTIQDLLLNLDATICKRLLLGNNAVLPNMSLLDPACGSGAFLVAAMKTLINVYAAILGKIDFLGDTKLSDWKRQIESDHPSINYFIKKQIISNNLYGVDIMEEATEIAKLRLFLALVSSANSVDQLEPLPNIDFNIMCGNSLVGLMRVDEKNFEQHQQHTLFRKSYSELLHEKNTAVEIYKNPGDLDDIQLLKNNIDKHRSEAIPILNEMLMDEFQNLGIKYQEITWDKEKKKEVKAKKRSVNLNDIKTLTPFHWGYDFSETFRMKDGFDAIITNPPWEVFKPNSKEFFLDYSDVVSKKKMSIKEFKKTKSILLEDVELRSSWLEYLSRFPHLSEYFRNAANYQNQISIVNGRKTGSDINLYKLFTEQCFNLLKPGGYCGFVIPSAIYSGLGTMQLRKMLFEKSDISNLISLSNEKFIFENVHHAYKFCFLSFKKGSSTKSFKAIFRIDPREAIRPGELDSLLHSESEFIELKPEFIEKLSPGSLSVMEFHGELDKTIIEKISNFPSLSDPAWQLKIGSEFHMTSDSYLFEQSNGLNKLPLYEGKMINQFESSVTNAKYWINEDAGRKAIIGTRGIDEGQNLAYQNYRIGFRAVAGNTNIRTIIVGPIPKDVFCGNSLIVTQDLSDENILYLLGFLNSYVVDFYARQMITTNVNMFYIYQLPVPILEKGSKNYLEIIESVAKLVCTSKEFSELYENTLDEQWTVEKVSLSKEDRLQLRGQLDALIASVYGLNEEEMSYILASFPVVPVEQRDLTYRAFKDKYARLSKANKWQQKISAGEGPSIEFKSTMRIDLKGSGRAEKFIEDIIIKTISAFLNSDGGTLFIGVEDNKNIIGLEPDFNSFSKPDKLDEFQKHLDNLIGKTIGNQAHHYLDIEFPQIDGKKICVVTVNEKSSEPIFIKNTKGVETFYIRRLASSIELSGVEMLKYCKEHWK